MTTVEQDRTAAVEIMPFGGWERTPPLTASGDEAVLFRFPAPDDPAPGTLRLLTMSLYAAALGLTAVGVGVRAMFGVLGGAAFWYVPALAFLALVSVALTVGSFLSIHRPALPWLLLLAATGPLTLDIMISALY